MSGFYIGGFWALDSGLHVRATSYLAAEPPPWALPLSFLTHVFLLHLISTHSSPLTAKQEEERTQEQGGDSGWEDQECWQWSPVPGGRDEMRAQSLGGLQWDPEDLKAQMAH